MPDQSDAGSPACFAHELIAGQPVDPQTALDVARFRRAERQRLWDLRKALPVEDARHQSERVAAALGTLIDAASHPIVAVYWPIRAELNLTDWMARAHEAGARIVLPVVVEKNAPLAFRAWSPGCRMERGIWNILVPADGEVLAPDIVVAPVVGVDAQGYRLGNGGGYYDRTLAAVEKLPFRIAVGHDFTRLPSIFPMHWDIPMQVAVLGDGTVQRFG